MSFLLAIFMSAGNSGEDSRSFGAKDNSQVEIVRIYKSEEIEDRKSEWSVYEPQPHSGKVLLQYNYHVLESFLIKQSAIIRSKKILLNIKDTIRFSIWKQADFITQNMPVV